MAGALREYARLLATYVADGGVHYKAWRQKDDDVAALSGVVGVLSSQDPASLPAAERFALYINLYNAKIVELVLTENPDRSIREIQPGITGFGVFLTPALRLGGERLSLRQLEDRLRRESNDPRIHFALNCASRSCPPLAREPYAGSRLDEQLEESARTFLSAPGAVEIRPGKSFLIWRVVRVEVSKIFDWYAKDFRPVGGVLSFIERYAPDDVSRAIREAGRSAKLAFQEYDWSLNDLVDAPPAAAHPGR